jgi:hypothetical protein
VRVPYPLSSLPACRYDSPAPRAPFYRPLSFLATHPFSLFRSSLSFFHFSPQVPKPACRSVCDAVINECSAAFAYAGTITTYIIVIYINITFIIAIIIIID